MPDTNFTVPQAAVSTLANALQQQLQRSAALHSTLHLVPVGDQQLVSAWDAFSKALTPIVEPSAPAAPTDSP